jgi:hypothetical protein
LLFSILILSDSFSPLFETTSIAFSKYAVSKHFQSVSLLVKSQNLHTSFELLTLFSDLSFVQSYQPHDELDHMFISGSQGQALSIISQSTFTNNNTQ